jgi:site-specific DNA recombinase
VSRREGSPRIRCAVYTRKSSDEGLDQAFNSLDAQREACEAYIKSQKHAGWVCLPDAYDDGGLSGATMERPALQRLLADIRQGKVQLVVVYKVDRLTRSLSDFARMVETFDAHGVSFVSVTQQFNTTSSMGRLTLNVLLSFAQFEREVTGERIRDKIAASKKKGLWMGGLVPLGYDAKDRKLEANKAEVETVRGIFRRYVELGSVHALKDELDARGIKSKVRVSADGRRYGGISLGRGVLYAMLQNPIYCGEIRHGDRRYPGQHAAIIDKVLWDRVQARLAENGVERGNGPSGGPSLLAGMLFDEHGHRMVPTHACKRGRRYRYYVSKPLITGTRADRAEGHRLPADEIERIVVDRLKRFLSDRGQVFDALASEVSDPAERKRLVEQAAGIAETWPSLPQLQVRAILVTLIARVEVRLNRVDLMLVPSRLSPMLRGRHLALSPATTITDPEQRLALSAVARLRRIGREVRFFVESTDPHDARARPDSSLIRLIAQAYRFHGLLAQSGGRHIQDLAKQEGVIGSYFTRVVRLAWLAPDITRDILDGHQPIGLSAMKLLCWSPRLPTAWNEQKHVIGFK